MLLNGDEKRMMKLAYLLLFTAISVAPAVPARSPAVRVLRGHVPAVVNRLTPIGRVEPSTVVPLSIGLPLRNREALTQLLQQLYDPASANYHQYLTPGEFTQRFGPTEQDYQAVIDFAARHGLTVAAVHPNRMLLEVTGTVAAIETAFHTTLRLYPHPTEARTFYAPEVEPAVEAQLSILDVSGLDNYLVPHPKDLRPAARPKASASGTGPDGSYMGKDFRAAYVPDVTLTGAGQSVGLFEFDGYYASDITQYERQAGLPNVALKNVLVSGASGSPGVNNVEVALDIEMAISMAPGLSNVIVYEGPNINNVATPNAMLNRMATDNLAKQLSSSWAFSINANSEQIFQQFAAQGQSFFDASGDSGGWAGTIPTPDDNPNITIVGGTTLATSNPGGAWVSETTWNWGQGAGASGGGISTTYDIPSWQEGIDMTANQGSSILRNVPDVSMAADDIWVIYGNGRAGSMGGTSAAAPLWAGFTALVNQQAQALGKPTVGFLNPALYAIGKGPNYADTFHDTTTGNNGNGAGSTTFQAVPGYDLCTGWGSPVGQSLINALAGPPDVLAISPLKGFTAGGPVGGPFTISAQDFSLTNAGLASFDWSLISTSLWLKASSSGGTLQPGGPAATVSLSLNSAANSLAVGAYTTLAGFSNRVSGIIQYYQFTLLVGQTLIQNGGFETGDFSYWMLSANSAFTKVMPGSGTGSNPQAVHSGSYGVQLGQAHSLGYLSQTIPTTPGQLYLLSFWLQNPFSGDTPNEFQVAWNNDPATNNVIYDQTNLVRLGWTNMQFLVQAPTSSATLQLGFRNDPQSFDLDDISVVAVPTPAYRSITTANGVLTLTWTTMPGLVYQVQYSSDLSEANWINLGGPKTATTTTLTRSDVIGPEPEKFYRLVLVH